MSPEGGSGMMQRLDASIEKNGVVVVDDMTLKLKLKRPDSLLLLALSNQQCYFTKANSKESDFEKGIGTGPFKLKFYNPGQTFEVDKYARLLDEGLPDRRHRARHPGSPRSPPSCSPSLPARRA